MTKRSTFLILILSLLAAGIGWALVLASSDVKEADAFVRWAGGGLVTLTIIVWVFGGFSSEE